MAAPKKPCYIRNLHNRTVHMRFQTMESEKPFRVNLRPRGLQGDYERIPANVQESPDFYASEKAGLFEIVPESEIKKIEYEPVTYSGQRFIAGEEWAKPITVVRNEERVVTTMKLSEEQKKGGRVEVTPVGPRYVNVPGSDQTVQNQQVNQPDATVAREVSRPDAPPESFNPAARPNEVTQVKTRKPVNKNPKPQKPQA